VRNVAHNAGLVLVVGSTNSSNSNRLVEVSRNLGTVGYLIDNSQAIDPKWLEGVTRLRSPPELRRPKCWSKTWSIICNKRI
jgi:4-hydroxy-3-methylbut-2-enyl diphosphate reductase IspH